MKRQLPSPELLRKLLQYDPETGDLHWKPRDKSMFTDGARSAKWKCNAWNSRFAGKKYGTPDRRGYIWGNILKTSCISAHSIVFAMHNSRWPSAGIDHIDGVTFNNKVENLREACQSVNGKNCAMSKSNTSGYSGVSFDRQTGKWRAYINISGKKKSLGFFTEKNDAVSERIKAEQENGYTSRWMTAQQ